MSKGSNPLTECSVILSEASLRAKSKDPQLVASSAWVADPSQAHVILSEASLRASRRIRNSSGRALGSRILRKLRMTFSLCRTRNLRDAVPTWRSQPSGETNPRERDVSEPDKRHGREP